MTPPPSPTVLPAADPADRPITLAVVIGAHGVTGEVRLKVFTADLGAHRSFNDGTLSLKSVRQGSNGMIARIAEVIDRNAAEELRGTELTVPRSALPPLGEGEYYHVDLIGLPVFSLEGSALGRVIAVEDFGAGDVIEVERPAVDDRPGARFMVPMTPDAVPEWSAQGLIVDEAFVV